ncbi:hypothetical protein [Acidisoma sp. C75]
MCGLCGSLSGAGHWSDPAPDTAEEMPSWQRRAERRQRLAAANRLLGAAGLSLSDWQGSRYLLRSRTGATAEVAGFGDLWPQADRLSAIRCDPLDPRFLDRLDNDAG